MGEEKLCLKKNGFPSHTLDRKGICFDVFE